MEGVDPADTLLAWRDVLDELTYYELFGVASDADVDAVRAAFHAFCDTFHPDRHVGRSDGERAALLAVFKRGTEAYHVLCDLALREHYDAQLGHAAHAPSSRRLSFSPLSRPPSRGPGPVPLEDSVRSPSARPFARKAEELVRKGDLRHAKLQLVLANHMDPGNEALEAALRDLEAQLDGTKP